jgi:hypothetical protein
MTEDNIDHQRIQDGAFADEWRKSNGCLRAEWAGSSADCSGWRSRIQPKVPKAPAPRTGQVAKKPKPKPPLLERLLCRKLSPPHGSVAPIEKMEVQNATGNNT